MKILKILLFILLASLILGELARLPLKQFGAINLSDLLVIVVFIAWALVTIFKKKKIYFPPGWLPILIFWLIGFASLVNALKFFSYNEVLVSSLFLFRFIFYSFIYLIVYNSFRKEDLDFWSDILIGIGAAVAFLGFLQFIVIPDLRFLDIYGWDPHFRRLVSTFLDPNYVGGFLVLSMVLLISKIIFTKKIKNLYWFLLGLFFVCIFLTFSRSSYLMLTVSLVMIGFLKSKKTFLTLIIIMLLLVAIVPKARERVVGAFTIDITAQARLDSWKNATFIAKDNLLLGVGFNTFRFAQVDFGFFDYKNPQGGHSGAGADSSFLTVFATSGIIGFMTYLTMIANIFVRGWQKKNTLFGFCIIISIIGIVFHSQFVNSLLFPLIMIWLWFIFGLAFVDSKNEDK